MDGKESESPTIEYLKGFNSVFADKDGQTTPNSILAQLIDMTRSADASSATRQTDVQLPPSSTPGQTPQQQQQENPEEGTNKVQKSVKCEGCGDLVINQEWILLNHVNTKWALEISFFFDDFSL